MWALAMALGIIALWTLLYTSRDGFLSIYVSNMSAC